jgi:hypothetical protein
MGCRWYLTTNALNRRRFLRGDSEGGCWVRYLQHTNQPDEWTWTFVNAHLNCIASNSPFGQWCASSDQKVITPDQQRSHPHECQTRHGVSTTPVSIGACPWKPILGRVRLIPSILYNLAICHPTPIPTDELLGCRLFTKVHGARPVIRGSGLSNCTFSTHQADPSRLPSPRPTAAATISLFYRARRRW